MLSVVQKLQIQGVVTDMSGVICLDCFQVKFDIIAIYVTRQLLLNFTNSHGAGVVTVGVGLMVAWSTSGYSVTTDGVSMMVGHYNHYNHYNHWKYLCTTSVYKWCKLDGWSASE